MNKIDSKLKADDGQRGSPSNDEQLQVFTDFGFTPKAAQSIVDIDLIMQRIRRGMTKRELVVDIVKELDPELDLSHLDAMSAISHWKLEPGMSMESEVTVGLVAERLNIDPSRASRLVAEVVEKGYVRRVASQADARRICLEPTEKGWAFGREFRRRKWEKLGAGLEGWTEEELVIFGKLLDRYSYWSRRGMERPAPGAEPSCI